MLYAYNSKIFGDINLINDTVLNIVKDISQFVTSEDIKFDLRLVLSELLINCYEHGNKCDSGKCINLCVSMTTHIISIEVCDEGDGIVELNKYSVHECKSSGRGLIIVKSLVDKFEIDKNHIRCQIHI